MNIASLIFCPDLGFFALTSLQSFKRRPDGLRACVRSLSSGGATRLPVGASRNDKQERRVSRLRDACILRLTRPLLKVLIPSEIAQHSDFKSPAIPK